MIKHCLLIIFFFSFLNVNAQRKIRVGAKHFNEGYILSELISQLLENEGFAVERKFNLGGTTIAFEALRNGDIDIYPEYSGTISNEIMGLGSPRSIQKLKQEVAKKYNLQISNSYGFSNTYALVVNKSIAKQLQLSQISDLITHTNLKAGLSHEFINRKDGWKNLAAYYNLSNPVNGIEHSLAYQALSNSEIDITDAYSTDGEISKLNLIVLKDDKQFFPTYEAVSFYGKNLPVNAVNAITKLENLISENEMQKMNAAALYDKKDFYSIAHSFLVSKKLISVNQQTKQSEASDFVKHILQHLWLTFFSIIISILIAVPLGIYLHTKTVILKPILFITSILQTIPSIALLALFIPLFGIGKLPAIVALCLYALLPILRNTITGLQNVSPDLLFVAQAIGLNQNQVLRRLKIPLSLPSIISGIRIAAVINVGTATLAAFIGAGGLGEYIVTGLALNNTTLILKGAIPSAILAVIIELLFDRIEKNSKNGKH